MFGSYGKDLQATRSHLMLTFPLLIVPLRAVSVLLSQIKGSWSLCGFNTRSTQDCRVQEMGRVTTVARATLGLCEGNVPVWSRNSQKLTCSSIWVPICRAFLLFLGDKEFSDPFLLVHCLGGSVTAACLVPLLCLWVCQIASYPSTLHCKYQIVYLHLIWFFTRNFSQKPHL